MRHSCDQAFIWQYGPIERQLWTGLLLTHDKLIFARFTGQYQNVCCIGEAYMYEATTISTYDATVGLRSIRSQDVWMKMINQSRSSDYLATIRPDEAAKKDSET